MLLIVDILTYEGPRLDFGTKEARITSCTGLEFAISVYTKQYHTSERPVYATKAYRDSSVFSWRRSPRVLSELPFERDYLFDGCHDAMIFYSHFFDANFCFVRAENDMTRFFPE